jgi:hypothetical protein
VFDPILLLDVLVLPLVLEVVWEVVLVLLFDPMLLLDGLVLPLVLEVV